MQDFRVSRHVTKQFHPARLSWSQLFMAKRSGNLAALIVPLSCPSHYRPTTAALLPRFCQTMMAPSVKQLARKNRRWRYNALLAKPTSRREGAADSRRAFVWRTGARSARSIRSAHWYSALKPSIRSPLPSGLKDDHVASDRPSIGRRIFRTLTRFFIAILIVSARRLPGSPTVMQQGRW